MARVIAENFNQLYYDSGVWQNNYWMGVQILKNPCDMMVIQEIIYETMPDTIVETGSFAGGSALFYSHCLILSGKSNGMIYSIDINDKYGEYPRPIRKNIEWVTGNSVDVDVCDYISKSIRGRTMVILDSCNRKYHVLVEMEAYGPLVTPGNYLIVEETNQGGFLTYPDPRAALDEFLLSHSEFVIDKNRGKHLLTFNPNGYLKRL